MPSIRGWVYVISNPAMPDIVKVGFSTKDPELRAREFDHTNSPYPFVVEYDALVESPRDIEQAVHRLLADVRENKNREWFRCSCEDAVLAIREVVGSELILENYKRADKAKIAEIERQRVEEIRRAEERVKAEEARKVAEAEIVKRAEREQAARFAEQQRIAWHESNAKAKVKTLQEHKKKAYDTYLSSITTTENHISLGTTLWFWFGVVASVVFCLTAIQNLAIALLLLIVAIPVRLIWTDFSLNKQRKIIENSTEYKDKKRQLEINIQKEFEEDVMKICMDEKVPYLAKDLSNFDFNNLESVKRYSRSITTDGGNKYNGEMLDGKYDGNGTLKYKNGDIYVGEFKSGMFNGKGKYTNKASGKTTFAIWQNGIAIKYIDEYAEN